MKVVLQPSTEEQAALPVTRPAETMQVEATLPSHVQAQGAETTATPHRLRFVGGVVFFVAASAGMIWSVWHEPTWRTGIQAIAVLALAVGFLPALRRRSLKQHTQGEWFALPVYLQSALQAAAFLVLGVTQYFFAADAEGRAHGVLWLFCALPPLFGVVFRWPRKPANR